jgi:hypothetical protein
MAVRLTLINNNKIFQTVIYLNIVENNDILTPILDLSVNILNELYRINTNHNIEHLRYLLDVMQYRDPENINYGQKEVNYEENKHEFLEYILTDFNMKFPVDLNQNVNAEYVIDFNRNTVLLHAPYFYLDDKVDELCIAYNTLFKENPTIPNWLVQNSW